MFNVAKCNYFMKVISQEHDSLLLKTVYFIGLTSFGTAFVMMADLNLEF